MCYAQDWSTNVKMEKEDEEVIFENSALYQHLQDVGFSSDDIHAEKVKLGVSADDLMKEVKQSKSEWLSSLKDGAVSRVLGFYQKALCEQDAYYKSLMTQEVVRSKSLVEDDAKFLENFVGSQDNQKTKKNPHALTMINVIRISSHWMIVLAYLVHRLLTSRLPSWYIFTDICAALVMAFYLIPTTVLYLFLWRHNIAWQQMMQQLQQYLTLSAALSQYMKKSVRFIQEMELINRGFTMVSALSPVARLEQSTKKGASRQCPQLRQMLFHVSRDIMLIHKRATCMLLDICPLIPEVDNSSNYIANISLDEYGPCLSITLNSQEAEAQLMEATDDYALAALKAMSQLCELQFSEFTRRFSMCHIKDIERPASKKQNKKLMYVYLLRELISKVDDGVGTLQRMYEFHKCSALERRRSSAGILPMAQTPQQSVYVAIHSLELHLLSLLKRVRDLEDTIQVMAPSEQSNLEVSILSDYQIMKMDLDACRGCWEEGMVRLEKMFNVESGTSDEVPKVEVPTSTTSSTDIHPIPLIEVDSPLIEDEVFEAYTEEDDEVAKDLSWDEFLTPEERAKKKREKEEAKRLLNELRSVISVKAAEREKRERAAIERMKGQQGVEGQDVNSEEGKVEAEVKVGGEVKVIGTEGKDSDGSDSSICDSTSENTLQASLGDSLKSSTELGPREECGQGDAEDGQGEKGATLPMGLSLPNIIRPDDPGSTPSSESCSWQVIEERQGSKDTTPSSNASWQVVDDQNSRSSGSRRDSSNSELDVQRRGPGNRMVESISSESASFELISKSTMAESESSGSFDIIPDSPEGEEEHTLRNVDPPPVNVDPENKERLEEKLERVCGADLAFTSNVAAMAVARSQNLGLQQETFGDDSDDDNDDDDVAVLES